MTRRLGPLSALPIALLLAFALVSCGGSSGNGVASKSPTEILAASKAAAGSASSVHVAGTLTTGGTPITLDLSLAAGHGGRGQISQGGLSFELIVLENTIYIKGSPAFYRHFGGTAAAQLFQGKWLKAPVSGSELATLASLANFGRLLEQTLASHGTVVKGATTSTAGEPSIELRDTTHNSSLFVATTGKPFPLELVKRGAETGRISFSEWDKPVSISAPPAAIDLSQLQHAGH